MVPRYERIGVGRHWSTTCLADSERWSEVFAPEKYPPENMGTTLPGHIGHIYHVAMGYYLADAAEECQRWSRRLLAQVDRYFFGDWRQSVKGSRDPGYYARGGGNWIDAYRTSAAFATALGDWRAVERLSRHPSEEKRDASEWYKSEGPWYLLLAEYLARGRTPTYEQHLAAIRSGGSRGAKAFAECLDAIVRRNGDELPLRFAEAMQYYLKSQKKRDEIGYKLALDGTILYHLAIRQGLSLDLQPDWRDHLVIL